MDRPGKTEHDCEKAIAEAVQRPTMHFRTDAIGGSACLGTRMTNRYRGTELLRTGGIVLAMTMISAFQSRAFFNFYFLIGQNFLTTISNSRTNGQAEIFGE